MAITHLPEWFVTDVKAVNQKLKQREGLSTKQIIVLWKDIIKEVENEEG